MSNTKKLPFELNCTLPQAVAFEAILSERDYQDMRQERDAGQPVHSVEDFLLFMQHYMTKTIAVASETWGPDAKPKTLDMMRKVVALGVACMEQHGCPRREGF